MIFPGLVGSLMWLPNQTRSDVPNAVRAVARCADKPRKYTGGYFRKCFRHDLSDVGITFQKGSGLELVVNVDADYTSKATDRRSVSGGTVMCAGACGCYIEVSRVRGAFNHRS